MAFIQEQSLARYVRTHGDRVVVDGRPYGSHPQLIARERRKV